MNHQCRIVAGGGLVLALLLGGCSSPAKVAPAEQTSSVATATVPASAEGISFVRDGELQFIRKGRAETVQTDGTVQAVGRASDTGGIVVIGDSGGSAGKVTWYASAAAKPIELWKASEPGTLGTVRYLKGTNSMWLSEYGDPEAVLKSATPPSGEQLIHEMDASFGGEFDADAKGESFVFVGKNQDPSTISIRDAEGSGALPVDLALIFSPDLSANGQKVCFVGGMKAGDLSVWTYDLATGKPAEVVKTRGLGPTAPVFSADAKRVAFRSAKDGALWVVDLKSGVPTKLPFIADEGPIGW
jgi:hypothetical protein